MRAFILFIFIIPLYLFSSAQDIHKLKDWHLIAAGSLLNGNTRTGAAVTMQVERNWKARWALGLGGAIDHYQFRTIPVFVSVKRFWKHSDHGLFFYGEGGINLPWPTDEQRTYRQGAVWGWGSIPQASTFQPGICTDLGIGYGFKGKKGHGMFIRVGQSIKTMGQRYDEHVWNGTSTVTAERNINYLFGRLGIQVGVRF